jgi:mono/diheme cytochrome c family protein
MPPSPIDRVARPARALLGTVFAGAIAIGGCSSTGTIAPVSPPAVQTFAKDLIVRGERLAAIGNCVTCHTARDGKPYAGGFPLRTPFGTVHGTNLTPDVATGIGAYSEEAFARALREGVDREGRHLYPAFPYDHFTLIHDEDVRALYAFFMTREPVRAEVPANTVIVPRPLVAVWKSLYFRPGRFVAESGRDPFFTRGQYLSEALAHCSSCHTPRNQLGAEQRDRAYAGGEVDGWHAPALNAESSSPVPWTAAAMTEYLRTGLADAHAIAAGPMAGVVRNLAGVPADDVAAIAQYVVALDTRSEAARSAQANATRALPPRGKAVETGPGAAIYAGACAECHDRGRAADGGALQLPLAIAPTLPTPANLIHIIRDGIVPKPHERSGWMPPYADALTDDELAGIVAYVRTFSGYPAWNDVPRAIREAKSLSVNRS